MNSTSKIRHRYTSSPLSLRAIAITLTAQFLTFPVSAQEALTAAELEDHISTIRELFQELDSAARDCVEDTGQDSCQAFAEALDGTFIPAYLGHCAAISDWREQLVEKAESGDIEVNADPGLASSLIGAEFVCGEDALAKRTRFAVAAFRKWQQETTSSQALAGFRREENTRTSPVSQALKSQQSRLGREIDQQWQRVELENIRQQLQKPIDYGDYNYPN